MWLRFSRSPAPVVEMIVRLSGAMTPITNAVAARRRRAGRRRVERPQMEAPACAQD